jgi:glutamate--cysteine ligase catalytic subunit
MEIQMTDFENAAFAVFVVLLTRAVLSLNLNFYMPISKVDENMQRAQHRDALRTEKFYFRKDIFLPNSPRSSRDNSGSSSPVESDCGCNDISNGLNYRPPKKSKKMRNCFPDVPPPPEEYAAKKVEDEYEEMTVEEVMNGKVGQS